MNPRLRGAAGEGATRVVATGVALPSQPSPSTGVCEGFSRLFDLAPLAGESVKSVTAATELHPLSLSLRLSQRLVQGLVGEDGVGADALHVAVEEAVVRLPFLLLRPILNRRRAAPAV